MYWFYLCCLVEVAKPILLVPLVGFRVLSSCFVIRHNLPLAVYFLINSSNILKTSLEAQEKQVFEYANFSDYKENVLVFPSCTDSPQNYLNHRDVLVAVNMQD